MTYKITRTTTLLFACSISISAMAAPVDQATAFRQAQSFLSGKGLTLTKQRPVFAAPKKTGTAKNASDYYIFNADNGKGFAVISGDDRTPQVLGYGLEGTLDASNLPVNIKEWLQEYQRQISYLDSTNVTTTRAKAMRAANRSEVRQPIPALLTTKWNQDEPYWNSCPVFGDLRGYTGCVATAMAQVMYHHRIKSVKKTTQTIPGYDYRFNSTYYYHENAVPAGTAIDWDNMLPDYSKVQATDVQKKAVADFIHLCGDAVKMMYSPFASGAYDQEVAKAMVNYFDYDPSTAFLQRADYTMENWNRIIYNELKNNRPVVYGGMSAASTAGGHCFVIDGYDGDEYYHVNWGWGGMGDGYFLLTSLLPDETGIGAGEVAGGYQYYQDAIINAQPRVGGEYSDIPLYIKGLTLEKDAVIKADFGNPGLYENKYTVGWGIIDNNGTITPLATEDCAIGTSYVTEITHPTTLSLKEHLTTPGTYHIVPISHDSRNTRWNICWDNYKQHYIQAVVGNDGSIAMTVVQPVYELTCEKLRVGGTLSAIQGHSLTATIRNRGISFDGHIHFMISSDGYRVYQDSVYVGIQQGKEATMSIGFLPVDKGSYTATVCTDIEGKNVLRKIDFKIVDEEKYDEQIPLLVSNINVRGLSENNPSRHEGAMLFTVFGDSISGGITLYSRRTLDKAVPMVVLQKQTASGWTPVDSTVQAFENIKQDQSYFRDYNFTHLEPAIYKMTLKLKHWSDSISNYVTDWTGDFDHYRLAKGATLYSVNGHQEQIIEGKYTVPENILAVDLRGCKAADITPNSNPNTIYIVRERDNTANLSGKNIVIYHENETYSAKNITLSDDHGYYSPVTFKAENVTYSRQFNDGGTWTTMQLPFTPTAVSGGTGLGSLNVAQFVGDIEQQAVFSSVSGEGLTANLPYLVRLDNIKGQRLTFSAENTTLESSPKRNGVRSERFKFTGMLATDTLYNVYTLSNAGTQFDFTPTTVAKPFRGYFMGYDMVDGNSLAQRPIVISTKDQTPTSISLTTKSFSADEPVYNLSGQKVGTTSTLQSLEKGAVYIVKGKVFVKN